MRNKVAINEKRASRLHWKMEKEKFVAKTFVDKKYLETFCVELEVNPKNGETSMQIMNLYHQSLRQEKTGYKGLNEAINAVNKFFERMDELIDNMPLEAQRRACNAYKNEIARAIKLN